MTVKSFRDLRVWQAAMDLVEKIYRLTQKFPNHEVDGLTNQLRRAAVSIPSNIGTRKGTHKGVSEFPLGNSGFDR